MTDHKESKKQKRSKRDQINAYARFSGVAFQMIAIIGLGTFGGVKLDEVYPNNYSIFTIICSLASVGAAMYYVIKQVNDISKRNNE